LIKDYEAGISILDEVTPNLRKIPLIFGSTRIEEDILELHRKLVNTKKLQEVIDTLRNRIPYFEDIREVEEDLFVWLTNIKESLPLSFMGDGFEDLVKLSFMAPLVKDGIVLFEEPEVSMHPGYLDILAEEIILNAKNSQFFITTHSLELVEYLLEKADERNKLDSIHVIKMGREIDGHISREVLKGNEAKEEREEIKTDLRGY
jgi:AAA15 family ATPase/GTPase